MPGAVANKIEQIRQLGGVRSREIAQLLNTTPQTVSRWQTGKSDPRFAVLQRLLTLEWILDQLSEFYRPDEARLWLFSPHRLLGGASPAQRIKDDRLDDVLALIDQLKSGAYV